MSCFCDHDSVHLPTRLKNQFNQFDSKNVLGGFDVQAAAVAKLSKSYGNIWGAEFLS